jgi:hypothetical protein
MKEIHVYYSMSDWKRYLIQKDTRKYIHNCYFKSYIDINRFLLQNDLYLQAGNCYHERLARSSKYISKALKNGGVKVFDKNWILYGKIYSINQFQKSQPNGI